MQSRVQSPLPRSRVSEASRSGKPSSTPGPHLVRSLLAFIAAAACLACEARFEERPSGLRFRELQSGAGTAARAGDLVTVHYTGSTPVQGEEILFFDSRKRAAPVTLPLMRGRVIPGLLEGLIGMRPGGRREIVVPPSLGYGVEGAEGVIPPNAVLYFEVELLELRSPPAAYDHDSTDLRRHPAGFEYAILNPGEGQAPSPGEFVRLEFSRYTAGGELLDSTRMYGAPYEFHLGQAEVPASLNAVAALLRPGGRAAIRVPYSLLSAVERQGVPADRPVRYDIEFLDVDPDHFVQEHRTRRPGGHDGHGH